MTPETIMMMLFGMAVNNLPNTNMSMVLNSHGYSFEEHHIITDDNYLLTVFRIPNIGKTPIFFQHGFLGCSVDWIIKGPKNALAYMAWEAGFDVWIGNSRGNFYSQEHTYLNTSSKEFWNFSWHEMGIYDLPAEIDYILNLTKQQQLIYVGYSQGGSIYTVMSTDRPEYNKKIKLAILIAPATAMSYTRSDLVNELNSFFIRNMDIIRELQLQEVLPLGGFIQQLFQFTSHHPVLKIITSHYLDLIAGPDIEETDFNALKAISLHIPSGASIKQYLHYSQLILDKGDFRHYDYGAENNMKIYNSSYPPIYNISKSTAPVYIIYSTKDILVDFNDVENFIKKLPSVVYQKRLNKFNHLNFIFGIHAREMINEPIIKYLKRLDI